MIQACDPCCNNFGVKFSTVHLDDLAKGCLLFEQKNYKKAAKHLEMAKNRENRAAIVYLLAECHHRLGCATTDVRESPAVKLFKETIEILLGQQSISASPDPSLEFVQPVIGYIINDGSVVNSAGNQQSVDQYLNQVTPQKLPPVLSTIQQFVTTPPPDYDTAIT